MNRSEPVIPSILYNGPHHTAWQGLSAFHTGGREAGSREEMTGSAGQFFFLLAAAALLQVALGSRCLRTATAPGRNLAGGVNGGRETGGDLLLRIRGGADAAGKTSVVEAPPAAAVPVVPAKPVLTPQQELWDAAMAGNELEAVTLVKGGANPNAFCSKAENMLEPNALQLACWAGHASLAEELIRLGADVNARNMRGYSALHFAALQGHLDVCKALVELGADVGCQDVLGDTPADRAEQAENKEVEAWLIKIMKEKGIKTNEQEMDAVQGELERLLADYDRSMIKDGPAGSFLPSYMKDDDGKLLPDYNDVATLYLKTKAMMQKQKTDPLDFETVKKFADEHNEKLVAEAGQLEKEVKEGQEAFQRAATFVPQTDEALPV